MAKLLWDAEDRRYEIGVDRGVLYSKNGFGEVWNGLTSVQEISSDSDIQTQYLDGVKVRSRRRTGEFEGTIEAFTYPESINNRSTSFGFSYRVQTDKSYDIHLIYNIMFSPPGQVYQQSETDPLSWKFTTKPVFIPYAKPSAHLIIKASTAYSSTLSALEDVLYGTNEEQPRLPTPEEVFDIFEQYSILRVIDHGNGTFTVTGPDEAIQMLDDITFEITWPTAVFTDPVSYTLSSL